MCAEGEMAGSVNLVVLIGNLGQDPDINGTGDRKVVRLSVATSESWRDKTTGERKEQTDWHRVVIFDKQSVEYAEKYLKKGMKVYVEGKQKTRKYEKDGATHYSTDVVLSGFGSKLLNLTSSGGGRGAPSEDDYGTAKTSDAGGGTSVDDEIPF
jgi:single-strand DNA-binding protein